MCTNIFNSIYHVSILFDAQVRTVMGAVDVKSAEKACLESRRSLGGQELFRMCSHSRAQARSALAACWEKRFDVLASGCALPAKCIARAKPSAMQRSPHRIMSYCWVGL